MKKHLAVYSLNGIKKLINKDISFFIKNIFPTFIKFILIIYNYRYFY
jgi:hypothetical protein